MTKQEQLKKMFARNRIVRASTIRDAGISAQFITNMLRNGEITRLGRGVYSLAEAAATEMSDIEALSHVVPRGVICLVSALRFHGLTDENPHEISVAVKHGSHPPKIEYPPVQFFVFSGLAYSSGVESHSVNGTELRVYSIEKTIADCFKYRNKIGLDIAVSALQDAVKKGKVNYNSLWESAKICRVSKIIRPYMEAVR